jgi:nicotinate-nucleotide adenylyltransferase
MTVIATANNPDFEVSRMEIDREGTTYTVDTLRDMRSIHGQRADLYFITGADAVWEIVTWKDVEEFDDLCTFIAATRPGYDLDAARREHADALARLKIEFIEVPALAISSTDIRLRVKEKRPIRYLTPESVVAYIEKQRLYQEAY